MNKGQGLATGALVLGAALLHPGGLSSSASDATHQFPDASAAITEASAADGPWKASCNYWKLAGSSQSSAEPRQPPRADMDITSSDAVFNWKLHVSKISGPPECDERNWGIPQPAPGEPVGITAIIATVPDPIHSSMALDFDRFMDVITLAAADNHYLMSYYWLPWNRPPENSRSTQTASSEDLKEAQAREKQPGLLILRPAGLSPPSGSGQHPHLIYLFLVAQTPALGINGDQIRNALRYEQQLRDMHVADLSIRDPAHGADVIGPDNSGSADSLRTALLHSSDAFATSFHVVGITSTVEAVDTLLLPDITRPALPGVAPRQIDYVSFGEDTALEQKTIQEIYGKSRLAFLFETGTAYGSSLSKSQRTTAGDEPVILNFPREISLLRNAQREDKTPTDAAAALAAANPYLHLSLKNSGTEDTIAHLSPELTPFSQEAQWMSIVRELKERHIETVSISASNILDQLFLAQSLHRDLPDARLVLFESSDLLFARAGDNAPYLGTLAATAYPLVDLPPSIAPRRLHNFASTWSESFYNAVSYTLWPGTDPKLLSLSGYGSTAQPALEPPALWMTTVGRDGYYPLSILKRCSSSNPHILPVVNLPPGSAQANPTAAAATTLCTEDKQPGEHHLDTIFPISRHSYPTFSWYFLCLVVTLLCLVHTLVLRTANFWSPTTRDLAIEHSDEPRRRTVYIHIATGMLLSMSVITVLPVFTTLSLLHPSVITIMAALLTLLAGFLAALTTLRRTRRYLTRPPAETRRSRSPCRTPVTPGERENFVSEASLYPLFNGIALLTVICIPIFWAYLCLGNTAPGGSLSFAGLFFGYRCLHPASGVSPLLPILVLLASWYIWALLQTKRLRLSENSRPMLPRARVMGTVTPLYVSDDALSSCSRSVDSCLFQNITCLLITRQLVRRFLHRPGSGINVALSLAYLVLFGVFVFGLPVQSLDRFLRASHFGLTPYEFLISALFYPLLVVALTGCVRMIAIWTSLRSGLLEPLERSPLRFAFGRLTNVAWMTMLRQSGLLEYWRDMTRSNEAMQQMLHNDLLHAAAEQSDPASWLEATAAVSSLARHTAALLQAVGTATPVQHLPADPVQTSEDERSHFLSGTDLPAPNHRAELNLMCAIECDYAAFAEALLAGVLVPFWTSERALPVESEPAVASAVVPLHIQLAEEFLAIRYLSLIRAVLINLRLLMTFVSTAFVFALLAWNSYPFEPRQWIDWAFTGLLVGLGSTIIWVFAQMHRNPILSRITGTEVNQLGAAFYLRLATFGAVPVLTWLASQFPAIGSSIGRLLESGLQLTK